jgi:agmatinase
MLATTANVVAADVVEVSPPFDHAETTINNAHRVIFEILAGIAHKRLHS